MLYVAFGDHGPAIAAAVSSDGLKWHRLGLLRFRDAPFAEKDAAFFPEPVTSPSGIVSLARSTTAPRSKSPYSSAGTPFEDCERCRNAVAKGSRLLTFHWRRLRETSPPCASSMKCTPFRFRRQAGARLLWHGRLCSRAWKANVAGHDSHSKTVIEELSRPGACEYGSTNHRFHRSFCWSRSELTLASEIRRQPAEPDTSSFAACRFQAGAKFLRLRAGA